MGVHVPRGDDALQALCGKFDSSRVHQLSKFLEIEECPGKRFKKNLISVFWCVQTVMLKSTKDC